MKKYDTLYAAGCSFTWHHPLKLEETWPYHLQRRMGIKNLVNNGQGGGSNYTIWRKTEEYCRTHDTSNHLAVIQLTNPLRFETYDTYSSKWLNHIAGQLKNKKGEKEIIIGVAQSMQGKEDGNAHLETLTALWNQTYEFHTYLQQIYAIDGVLRKAGVDVYYMNYNCSHFFPEYETCLLTDSFNWINGDFNAGDIVATGQLHQKDRLDLKEGFYIDDCDKHPNDAGNQQIAKFIYEWVKENPLP